MIKKLSDFGYNFQIKLIAALMTDKNFLQQISDILEYKYFESEATSFLVKCIKSHVVEFKTSPTLEVLKVKIKEIEFDDDYNDMFEEDEEEFVFGDTSGPGFGGPNDPNDTDFSPSQMGGGY